MKNIIFAVAMLFSSLALAEDCFDASFVHHWDYNDETETLTVQSFDDKWDVKTFPCWELKWAHAIGFETFMGSQVCRGDKVLVVDAFNNLVDKCHIQSIKKVQ